MEPKLKGCLKAIVLALRRELEGSFDAKGSWQAGDLERRLAAIGVRKDRAPVPIDELPHLSKEDREARRVLDAFLKSRSEAGLDRAGAVEEFIRQAAYTWANRLLALRCMEARGLIDEVILQKEAYGGRSLQHNRVAKKSPERCSGEDEGLFATLFDEFERRAKELPLLFNPKAPEVALHPSIPAIKRCLGLLSGVIPPKGQEPATDDVFTAPDAFGWAYQYWNTDEKDRVFEKVRTKKGAKIEGAEIIPATCIYTEPYIVKFLVQNSLGALWMGMRPASKLAAGWEYYVRDADRAPVQKKPVRDITFLDPACGSGHFLIEAFDLFHAMYKEEGAITAPAEICAAILERNLYGIDIDERAVQIAGLALVMKAKEKAPDFVPRRINLVATNIRLPAGKDHLDAFLRKHPDDTELKPALLTIFENLAHADELGSLLQIEEPVERELKSIRRKLGGQLTLTGPKTEQDWEAWKTGVIERLRQHFDAEAHAPDLATALFGEAGVKGFSLADLLARRYDVVAANPPYLGCDKAGRSLSSCLKTYRGGADLYGAFLERSMSLLTQQGVAAILSLSGFTYQDDFLEFRKHLIETARLVQLVHLSNKTFESLSNPNAFYFIMSIVTQQRSVGSQISVIDLDGATFEEKETVLRQCIRQPADHPDRIARPRQDTFLRVPGCPIAFRLPPWAESSYAAGRLVRDVADARQGLATGDNDRFLRFRWEVSLGSRWYRYAKGGEFKRWFGNDEWAVDWEHDGVRIRNLRDPNGKLRSRPQNVAYFFRDGGSWSSQTISAFGVRRLEPQSIFDVTGSSVFPQDRRVQVEQLLGLLNTPAFGELFGAIQGGVHYGEGYLADLPVPKNLGDEDIVSLVRDCISIQQKLHSFDPTSAQFRPDAGEGTGLKDWGTGLLLEQLALECKLHNAELQIWDYYESQLAVPTDQRARSRRFPLPAAATLGARELLDAIECLRIQPTAEASRATQCGMEEVAAAKGILPARLMSIISESGFKQNLRQSKLLVRFVEELASVLVSELLGHQWPREVEGGEAPRAWADRDGIIPLSENAGEPTLLARVRARFAADFGAQRASVVEQEFEDLVGKSLGTWLVSEFFPRHISQFRKRPIAWQLTSTPGNNERRRGRAAARNAPVFSCLVYYHRLDADLLPKLRSQYVGPLRSRFQTELAGLEKVRERTADQDAQRVELETKIEELKAFDARIEEVIARGFDCTALVQVTAKEPVDKWTSRDGRSALPSTRDAFLAEERRYAPDLNDGVRVNIAPLQKAGLLAADVLALKDLEEAIADRAAWRADERCWCREGKLPRPGWWPAEGATEPTSRARSEASR